MDIGKLEMESIQLAHVLNPVNESVVSSFDRFKHRSSSHSNRKL